MHYHCEIVLPPGTEDIEAAIGSVMEPFNENLDEDHEEYSPGNGFWDFYVIGGRFAGRKMLAKYDKHKVEAFEQWCQDEKITVSGIQCGKPSLSPTDQIQKVDAKWNEMFPASGGVMVACPLFDHSNDQYGRDGRGTIDGDICPLGEAKVIKCTRVIFAGPAYSTETKEWTGRPEAKFMLCEDHWNGCNHMPIAWDGTVGGALDQWLEKIDRYVDQYRELIEPNDDWITVTVDYHS